MANQFLSACPHCKGIITLSIPNKAIKSVNNIFNKLNQSDPIEYIIDKTCELTGIKRDHILDSTNRSRTTSFSRHIAMYVLKTEIKLSFPEIGKLFNQSDHTSAMYGFLRVKKLIEEKDQDVINVIEAIKNDRKQTSDEKEDLEIIKRIKEIEEQLKTGTSS